MTQSSQQVRSTAECCQIWRKSSLAGWAAVLGFAAFTLGPFGLAMPALTAHPPNWIQTNSTTRRRTKRAGLIESCTQGIGAPLHTPGRTRRKNVTGGSAPRLRWSSVQNPVQDGGLGAGAASGVWAEPQRQSFI